MNDHNSCSSVESVLLNFLVPQTQLRLTGAPWQLNAKLEIKLYWQSS